MIEIRISKILIVISCALLGGLPGLSNVLDYEVNLVNVQHVLSMDVQIVDTFAKSFKAINSPIIHHLAYILIIISEFLVGILGIWGAVNMWNARHDVVAFNRSKGKAIWAFSIGLLIWLMGFMVVGGEWFLMWLSPEWNSQQSAFRIVIPFMLGLMFIAQKDEQF